MTATKCGTTMESTPFPFDPSETMLWFTTKTDLVDFDDKNDRVSIEKVICLLKNHGSRFTQNEPRSFERGSFSSMSSMSKE